ncbi:PfkB family carbohydrate kinase [Thiohalomonas denitrificans]|uniref:Fructokinase n=1 Tax=Thiohalomonas denitrificans TaxID=415747 RepID=A0A1G5PJE0_9GAMM|nr:PfkB family carbohydrate kinase [Thiohalomonas denitrificans]SCZ49627.1 fructokinase [Thiohalomonas denitrificans]
MREERLSQQGRPVIFGEVLFDDFEDQGVEVLGGAPFNVAWHLQGFGLEPVFITRIGDDRQGQQVHRAMTEWGMSTSGLQLDPRHPTGKVRITLEAGQPTFSVLPDRAYDFIDDSASAALPERPALLYHGSLAARHTTSAATLNLLREQVAAPRFVDVNLRAPWWDRETLTRHLTGCRWVKLNGDEVAQLAARPVLEDHELQEGADALRLELGIETLIVTLGEEGAFILDRHGVWRDHPPPITDMADTVGAGDAFSAVCILGLMQGWPLPQILQRALAFAAEICHVRGATIADKDFYQSLIDSWE